MEYSKYFFDKVFSEKRMTRYFSLYPNDETKAILHYQSNIQLAEAFYVSLSVFEVALRNALSRELETMSRREDWYAIFSNTPGLSNLNKYITKANKQIAGRHEISTPSKITAELTMGFWVSLLNREYERLLWKDLRRAFPYMPKNIRQRKNISAPLNKFRIFRNRVFHNETICWNLQRANAMHKDIIKVMGWINKDIPSWIKTFDRFDTVFTDIVEKLK